MFKKVKTGKEIIGDAVGKITDLVVQLEEGITLTQVEKEATNTKYETEKAEWEAKVKTYAASIASYEESIKRGKTLKANISKLLEN